MAGNDNPFEATLDKLRADGWWQNDFWKYGPGEGPACIRGAAIGVGCKEDEHQAFVDFLTPILDSEYPERRKANKERVACFNDHPDTTFADVERVLEKAAVKWEEERVLRHD